MVTTLDELVEIHEAICTIAKGLVKERGLEYSPETDTLATFKKTAELTFTTPSDVCINLMGVKMSRICQQAEQGRIPFDSIYDLINYAVYLTVLIEEEKQDDRD